LARPDSKAEIGPSSALKKLEKEFFLEWWSFLKVLKSGFLALPAKPENNGQHNNSQAPRLENFCYNFDIIFESLALSARKE